MVTPTRRLTAVIERDGNGYVALCPELDIASQGDTVEESQHDLQEAVQLFLEEASPSEIRQRLQGQVYVTSIEVAVGRA
jgi:predicted RNase H-like HicB family nuclease